MRNMEFSRDMQRRICLDGWQMSCRVNFRQDVYFFGKSFAGIKIWLIFAPQLKDGEIAQLVRAHDS